ncbi:MAG: putative toxin-antitoxin system toxin component, PIN family [Dehalococcoidia bacterium]|nr:putative toxin-antitoxin system toxin component, PIN family [Dehalococcoidia bacterium]
MRAVLDTNVIVSAILSPGSSPDSILRASRRGALDLVTSAPLLHELEDVLGRPRIAKRLGWTAEERASFIAAFSDFAVIVAPKERFQVVRADPADNRVLEAAVAGSADYAVSGDHHLLDLGSYEGIPIVTPARFAAILAASER